MQFTQAYWPCRLPFPSFPVGSSILFVKPLLPSSSASDLAPHFRHFPGSLPAWAFPYYMVRLCILVSPGTSLLFFWCFFFLGNSCALSVVVDPVTVTLVTTLLTCSCQCTLSLSRPDFKIVRANVLCESLCESDPYT